MKKQCTLIVSAAVLASVFAAGCTCGKSCGRPSSSGKTLLVVPGVQSMVDLGFDLIEMNGGALDMACYKGIDKVDAFEFFDRYETKWMHVGEEQWKTASYPIDRYANVIVVGAGAAHDSLVDSATWAQTVLTPDGRRIHEVANAVDSLLPLSEPQWKTLASKHGLTIKSQPAPSRYDNAAKNRYQAPAPATDDHTLEAPFETVETPAVPAVEVPEVDAPVAPVAPAVEVPEVEVPAAPAPAAPEAAIEVPAAPAPAAPAVEVPEVEVPAAPAVEVPAAAAVEVSAVDVPVAPAEAKLVVEVAPAVPAVEVPEVDAPVAPVAPAVEAPDAPAVEVPSVEATAAPAEAKLVVEVAPAVPAVEAPAAPAVEVPAVEAPAEPEIKAPEIAVSAPAIDAKAGEVVTISIPEVAAPSIEVVGKTAEDAPSTPKLVTVVVPASELKPGDRVFLPGANGTVTNAVGTAPAK